MNPAPSSHPRPDSENLTQATPPPLPETPADISELKVERPKQTPEETRLGPGEALGFAVLGQEAVEFLEAIGATLVHVKHQDGKDHITLTLPRPATQPVPQHPDIDRVKFDTIVKYTGQIFSNGRVEVTNISGITADIRLDLKFFSVPFKDFTPTSVSILPNGQSRITGTQYKIPVSKEQTLDKQMLHDIRSSIEHFEKLRDRST